MGQANWAFTLGDKYNLPKLRDRGALRLISFHHLFAKEWTDLDDILKISRFVHLEEVWAWTYPETEKFKNAILESFCGSANAAIEDTKFEHFLLRNTDFALDLIKRLAKDQKDTTTSPSRTISPVVLKSLRR